MKKCYSILIVLITLMSCKKQAVLPDVSSEDLSTYSGKPIGSMTTNSTSLSTSDLDWTGIPLNIIIDRGVTTNKKFLSSTDIGHLVDLYHEDDASGRQRWILEDTGDGYFSFKVYGGITNNKKFLSALSTGTLIDLYHEIDLSGRQKWSLYPLGNDLFNIKIKGGISTGKNYLSCNSTGSIVDLHHEDDGSGRQQWRLEPSGEFDLVTLEYSLNPDDYVKAKPNFVSSLTLNNNTSVNQQMNVSFSKKATESSTFSKTYGISLKVGATAQVGVPVLATATVSADLTTSGSWTYGNNESKEDSQSYSFTAIVPAHRIVVAKAIVSIHELTTNYIATFRHRSTGVTKRIQGRWTGIQASSVYYELTELQTGTILAKYDANGARLN
ncbi:ETX/MTX2 family pore-forming toxin [Pedobacter sp. WC2501]|uniref:ETX/MTX2 family pore-forming toxin n=1 Tax=Pedobacter sp. WC2501 TaxID=3461400 RepID=UPI004046120E